MKQQQADQKELQFTVRKRAVLYARTSKDDKKTDSLSSQIAVCEQFANEQGYTIVDRLSEDVKGVKGDDRNAPALNKALEMAQAGLFDVLIIRDVKRYSRDVYKAMDFEGRFFDNGIEIEYPWNKELNGLPRRGTGFVMRFLQYWMSEEDRKHIVSKLYYKRIEHVRDRRNIMTQQRPPYGYAEKTEVVDGQKHRYLVILEDEARWVRKIFEWYVIDGLSLRAIQRKLKQHCVPRPSERKKVTAGRVNGTGPYDWSHNSVRAILARKAYTGLWEYGKTEDRRDSTVQNSIIADELVQEPVSVEIPAIISQEMFEAAQDRLSANKKRTHKKSPYKFLMRGRISCGKCGRACRCEADKRCNYRVYRCTTRVRKNDPANPKTCDLPPFKRDIVDRDVWQWLMDIMEDDKKLREGYEDHIEATKHEIEPLQAELERIENNLADLNERLTKQALAITTLEEMGSKHAVDAVKAEIMRIENLIDRNSEEKARLQAELEKKAVEVNLLEDFDGFVTKVRRGMKKAQNRFEKQREVIEVLNTTVELTVKDGQPMFIPRCVLKPDNDIPVSCTSTLGYLEG